MLSLVLLAPGKGSAMTQYVATINIPGYLPQDDEPPVFDTAREAWEYLAEERERGEDAVYQDGDSEDYSATRDTLAAIATEAHWQHGAPVDLGVNADGTGTVYGATPGYDGTHDLGIAYSVSLAIECDHNMSREKVTCGACGRSWCDRCNPTHGPRCAFEYDHPTDING